MIPFTGTSVACNIGNLTDTSAANLFGATNFLSLTKVEDDLDKMMSLTNCLLSVVPIPKRSSAGSQFTWMP